MKTFVNKKITGAITRENGMAVFTCHPATREAIATTLPFTPNGRYTALPAGTLTKKS